MYRINFLEAAVKFKIETPYELLEDGLYFELHCTDSGEIFD